MRRFILSNAQVFQRLDHLELKQIETDQKIDKVLTAFESRDIQPKQGIFLMGRFLMHISLYLIYSDVQKSLF
jgi:hypothetical protein